MDDGLVLRADVFRPVKEGRYPVILSYGPYAKGSPSRTAIPAHWQRNGRKHPTSPRARASLPELGSGRSREMGAARLCLRARRFSRRRLLARLHDHFSPRETKDFYDCIEWAGVQPWSNGKVGLNGISYYGINQWHVASLEPPHSPPCASGGRRHCTAHDHHCGIVCTFWENWYDMQVKTVQYGAASASAHACMASLPAGRKSSRRRARQEPQRLR